MSKANDTNIILATDGSSNGNQRMYGLRPLIKLPVTLSRALHVHHEMQYIYE